MSESFLTLTSQNTTDRLHTRPHPGWETVKPPDAAPSLHLYPDDEQQELLGFGGAFTEATAYVYSKLGPQNRRRFLDAYFDPDTGHGYRMGRTHINSCDFGLGNYAYTEVPGDVTLEHFSLDHERDLVFPLLRDAQAAAKAPLKLFASPWSPPAWMKTTGEMNNGGKLKPEYRQAWAQYYVRYIREMEKEGFPIWGLTVQNEPAATQIWDSCEYTAEEERDFVRDYLGPALRDAGLGDRKLIIWDHNRDVMPERARVVLSDPKAAAFVWGTGFHWYGEDAFEHVAEVRDEFPDHHLIFTEGCQEGGPHLGSWELGERYARSIIHDLNNGTEAWVDWNLMLDISGGPNHVGNLCSAPVIADIENDTLLFQSSYWAMGHFSRFFPAGSRIIPIQNERTELLATAVRFGDTVRVVILNLQEQEQRVNLRIQKAWTAISLPPRSIASFQSILP